MTIPVPMTHKLLELGRKRYDITCGTCHGPLGDGDSIVARQMALRPPPSLHRYIDRPAGYIYEVITKGFGMMASYAAELTIEERWAVVAYIRALQLSQNTPAVGAVPADSASGWRPRRRRARMPPAARPARASTGPPPGEAVSSHAPSIPTAEQIQKLPPFRGGNGADARGGGIGAVLLLAITLAAGGMTSPKETYYSYLVAFAYWCRAGVRVDHPAADAARHARALGDRAAAARSR